MAIAGVTCVDWSSLGCKGGWLGDSSLPFLFWARERHFQGEDIIIIECTPQIDHATIADILPEYTLHMFDVCSSALGVPATRRRKYSVLLRNNRLIWMVNCEKSLMSYFKQLFGQDPRVDARHFVSAPDDAVQAWVHHTAKRQGFPTRDPRGKPWKPKALLSSAVRDRVRAWEDLVRTERNLGPSVFPTAFMNATQNPRDAPLRHLKCNVSLWSQAVRMSAVSRRRSLIQT